MYKVDASPLSCAGHRSQEFLQRLGLGFRVWGLGLGLGLALFVAETSKGLRPEP